MKNLPENGKRYLCKLQHYKTKQIIEYELIKVTEDDCEWRTADDNSEISYNWDVVQWCSLEDAE